jgi:hypothetical protein
LFESLLQIPTRLSYTDLHEEVPSITLRICHVKREQPRQQAIPHRVGTPSNAHHGRPEGLQPTYLSKAMQEGKCH